MPKREFAFVFSIPLSFFLVTRRYQLTDEGWRYLFCFTWKGEAKKKFGEMSLKKWNECRIEKRFFGGLGIGTYYYLASDLGPLKTTDFAESCRFLLEKATSARMNRKTYDYLCWVAVRKWPNYLPPERTHFE